MSENNADGDFVNAGNLSPIASASNLTRKSSIRSSVSKKKVDPYNLDFTQLRKNYVTESSVKLPFVKSSFTHYSKCPRDMEINNKAYRDLVITMEVVQAPEALKYTQLEDPVEARKKVKLAKQKAAADKKKEEARAVKEAAKNERMIAKAALRAEKAARKLERNNRIQSGEDDDEEEEDEESAEEDTDDDDSDEDDHDHEDHDHEDHDDDDSDDDSDEEEDDDEDEDDDDEDDSDYGSEMDEAGDREYTGDMFKGKKPVKFAAAPFEKLGQHNAALETNDYCCISLWSAGGKLQRYTRLKDTTLRVPPIGKSRKFRVGHDAKRLYYLGEFEGVHKLVIIYLKDLTHEFIDLGPDANKIISLEGSSLFGDYICYAIREKIEVSGQGRKMWRYTKNFSVLNIRTQEKVWELPDCENVLFQGKEASKQKQIDFEDMAIKLRTEKPDDDEEEEEDEIAKEAFVLTCEEEDEDEIDSDQDEDEGQERYQRLLKGVLVIKSVYDDRKIEPEEKKAEDEPAGDEDKKDGAEEKKDVPAEAADAAEEEKSKTKILTFRKIQAFLPQWGKKVTKRRLVYETEIESKMMPVPDKVAFTDLEETETKAAGKKVKQLHENPLLAVTDNHCLIMSLIIKGLLGDQHNVHTFNFEFGMLPSVTLSKAGNLELEFNMNSHVRNLGQIFICETSPNNDVSAKQVQISLEEKIERPAVNFTKAERGFAKDCWTVVEEGDDDFDPSKPTVIMTLCKSSTDEYLNADCVTAIREETEEDMPVKFKTTCNSSKIKAQEIQLNYPCLVSNVGLSRLMIQSMTCPDQVNSFNLEHLKMEFICFADYRTLNDIGLKDSRDLAQSSIVPLSETGEKIAFVTRKRDVCDKEECEQGDMLLNVLSIDSYASPMRFELHTTSYEACMDEGMNDDAIQTCVAMQVTSARGLDVAFVAQYNDRIIFDCITSERQLPLRFPLPANKNVEKHWRTTDPDFQKTKGEIQFENVELFKGAEMVRQPMIMDDKGAIFFMIKNPETHQVKVVRTDPLIEMGGDGFIKSVYSLRATHIYFLLHREGVFYIMDEQKKIRVLKPNEETQMWVQDTTFELPVKDAKSIVYSDFDEYCISDGVLHANEQMYFLLDSRAKDNATWESQNIMLENHLHVSGPRYAKESGLIWYIQQYAQKLAVEQPIDEDADHQHGTHDHAHAHSLSDFRGFSVVMQPLGDLSYLDLLPRRGENHNNFCSFVSDEHILVNYSGRYLIFDRKGMFLGAVKFTKTNEGFRGDQIKLVNVSDSGKFFVFQGPKFLTKTEKDALKAKKKAKKEKKKAIKKALKDGTNPLANVLGGVGDKVQKAVNKASKKAGKNESGGKKAPIFYVFKLQVEEKLSGTTEWSFAPYETVLYPYIETQLKATMTQRIDYAGVLSQCLIKGAHSHGDDEERHMEIIVKNYNSEDKHKTALEQEDGGMFGAFRAIVADSPDSEERYRLTFKAWSHEEKKAVLERKIGNAQRNLDLGHGNQDSLTRLQRRGQQIERAWIFDNYIVAKSGCEIKYIAREKSILGMYATSSINFAVDPGAEVWIENIFSTGIEDLIQLFILDDVARRIYIITWNLQLNREHSMFQTTYAPDIFPENLVMQGKHVNKQSDFNYFMDSYAIINLETNLPVQFFDTENESDVLPKGPMHSSVAGMKRVSSDWSRYLDMTKPGRVHHFISLADLMYWERFQTNKDKHEISKGIMSTFSPIARFPAGISVFHYFATNVKVLNVVEDTMNMALQSQNDDVRVKMLPLVFLHSNPKLNAPGRKTTPIHIALDKQSPIAFELMFQMLVNQTSVCVTSQLLDVLDTIINTQSQAVLDFFNNSFLITDQFAGLRALEWEEEGEEKICAVESAYITDEYLQNLVKKQTSNEDEEVVEQVGQDHNHDGHGDHDDQNEAPFKYCDSVEPRTHEPSDSNIKQIEAKILDFNWAFVGDNSQRLLTSLAESDNDEIFAQAQVRVFIDFMWQGYYDAIFSQLFLPFLVYFTSFILYSGYFASHEDDELSIAFVQEIICVVLFGKTFFTFLILEIIQIRSSGYAYFLDVWNLVDFLSLILNATYVYGEISNSISFEVLQVLGSVAVLLLWVKMFYWMRLFKPFSAFIRMISEIIKDIKVFLVMLLITICAFANIIFVLNANRIKNGESPIFEDAIGIPPVDAIIHAYLTGLGEFGKDDYSEHNSRIVWIMFILATVIVQLIFLNLLIAIMGESFSRITAIMQQSTLKEICGIMVDHIWLQKISEIFENKRYILWLTPDTSTSGGTVVERQLQQLKELVKSNSEAQEARVLRAISSVQEDVATLAINVAEVKKIAGDAKSMNEDDEESDF